MKKSIVITLALALLLALCVSCSSDMKQGKLVIDTKAINEWAEDEKADITKAELWLSAEGFRDFVSEGDIVIDLNPNKVKKGEVSTKVDVGSYSRARVVVYYSETDLQEFLLERVPGTKYGYGDSFIVNPGHTVYLKADFDQN